MFLTTALSSGLVTDDTLNGTKGRDSLCARGVGDSLFGHRDDDALRGGRGNDLLLPDRGNDIVRGLHGFDILSYGTNRRGVIVNLRQGRVYERTPTTDVDLFFGVETFAGGGRHGNDWLLGNGDTTRPNKFFGHAGHDA
jgi:Ca2+-binding RTX toxin-like protein